MRLSSCSAPSVPLFLDNMKSSNAFQLVLYGIIFSIVYILCNLLRISQYAPYAVFLVNIYCYLTNRCSSLALFSSFAIGNELISVLNLIVGFTTEGLGRRACPPPRVRRCNPSVLACLFLLLSLTFANALVLGTFINSLTSISYYGLLFVVFKRSQIVFSRAKIHRYLRILVFCESLIVLSTCFMNGFFPSDSNYGSLGNAHFLGIWCALSAIAMWSNRDPWPREVSKRVFWLVPFVLCGVMAYLSDTKAPIACGVLVAFASYILLRLTNAKTVVPAFVSLLVAFFLVVTIISSPQAEKKLTDTDMPGSTFFNLYLYDDEMSIKYDYFFGTTVNLFDKGKIITGYGLGQYGSRFANLYGYSFAYREDSAINDFVSNVVESRMLEDYQQFASRYNNDIVNKIQYYSAIAVYPFSSVLAFVAEGGIVGVLLLCLIFGQMSLSRSDQILLMFFLGCCVVDLYLDHIQLAGMVLACLAAAHPFSEKKLIQPST